MPSNFTITVSPTSVPRGGSATVTVSEALAPATSANVSVKVGSAPVASVIVPIQAEVAPVIKVAGDPSITPTDYVIAVDVGTLTATATPGVFTLKE